MIRHRPFRILLVEDNPADIYLFRNVCLSTAEYQGSVETEPAMTLAAARALMMEGRRYDLIVLDLNLPDGYGLEFLNWVRQQAAPQARVIVMSSSVASKEVEQAYRRGASAYIHKPNTLEEYERTCRYTLRFWKDIAVMPRVLEAT
jgi:CheY-like chemotaxis protein